MASPPPPPRHPLGVGAPLHPMAPEPVTPATVAKGVAGGLLGCAGIVVAVLLAVVVGLFVLLLIIGATIDTDDSNPPPLGSHAPHVADNTTR